MISFDNSALDKITNILQQPRISVKFDFVNHTMVTLGVGQS